MSLGSRLPPNQQETLERSKRITIYYEGKPVSAFAGETVASALYASGTRIFSRSFKYHRPRGLLCVSGRCPNCLMNVDGAPNVRTCTEIVNEGMKVEHQNAWPSLGHDFLSIIDRLSRFLPVGFYYKTFIKPRFIWPLAEKILRRIAGLGRVKEDGESPKGFDHEFIHTDILVVGGGASGIAAALEASKPSVRVLLVDDQPKLGGHLRFALNVPDAPKEFSGLKGYEIARELAQRTEVQGVKVLSNTTVFGHYEGGLLGAVKGRRLIKIRAKATIVATGSRERPLQFQNNDLPGIFLGTGFQRLLQLYRVKPGDRCLVVSSNDQGFILANDLLDSGLDLVGVVDARPSLPGDQSLVHRLREAGIPLMPGTAIKEAKGGKHVRAAVISELNEYGSLVPSSEKEIECDTICLSTGFDSETALLYQSGSKIAYDSTLDEMVPETLVPGSYAVGEVTGIHNHQISLLQGTIAGLSAVLYILGRSSSKKAKDYGKKLEENTKLLRGLEDRYRRKIRVRPLISATNMEGKNFVCICEDVTVKDIFDAVGEGFQDLETLKRYSTVTMGPCQGKMCSTASAGLCGIATERGFNEVGVTTSRPPISPVTLGALGGGTHLPVKLTPMHYRHLDHGASLMDMGEWKRPFIYTTPEEEYRAVRERVGIIDVSTLGKLDVRGKDAPKLLDLVYTQNFSNLKVGRIRYSVICDESGAILDDGTVTRLAEDRYFVTTTTGNVEFVEEWFKWWAESLKLCAHITNVTAAYAAINVAGPKARDTLSKLTTLDLTSATSPYMSCGQAKVGGVPSLLLRIGFVGETGWEIHFPAEYGDHVWDSIMEAGKESGIAPFGVEAQRILRLDKKHIIVGQDTDALSTPIEADMNWVMKFEKPDFIGKQSLLRVQARGSQRALIGFVVNDSSLIEDGNGVLHQGKPVGFVTSARFSPHLGKSVGLALVPPELAKREELFIHNDGKIVKAQILGQPFYDPDGSRLRM